MKLKRESRTTGSVQVMGEGNKSKKGKQEEIEIEYSSSEESNEEITVVVEGEDLKGKTKVPQQEEKSETSRSESSSSSAIVVAVGNDNTDTTTNANRNEYPAIGCSKAKMKELLLILAGMCEGSIPNIVFTYYGVMGQLDETLIVSLGFAAIAVFQPIEAFSVHKTGRTLVGNAWAAFWKKVLPDASQQNNVPSNGSIEVQRPTHNSKATDSEIEIEYISSDEEVRAMTP